MSNVADIQQVSLAGTIKTAGSLVGTIKSEGFLSGKIFTIVSNGRYSASDGTLTKTVDTFSV